MTFADNRLDNSSKMEKRDKGASRGGQHLWSSMPWIAKVGCAQEKGGQGNCRASPASRRRGGGNLLQGEGRLGGLISIGNFLIHLGGRQTAGNSGEESSSCIAIGR